MQVSLGAFGCRGRLSRVGSGQDSRDRAKVSDRTAVGGQPPTNRSLECVIAGSEMKSQDEGGLVTDIPIAYDTEDTSLTGLGAPPVCTSTGHR